MSAFFISISARMILKGGTVSDFYLPTEIFFKQGILSDSGAILKNLGSRVLLITTTSDLEKFGETLEIISSSINSSKLGFLIYDEIGEVPNTEYIDSATYFAKKSHCDVILGFGGINSMNAAKAVSVLANNYLFCEDLFENPSIAPPIPLVTLPTHPLSGFEILPLLYLRDLQEPIKKIYTHRHLFPKITIIDPMITLNLDDETTTNSGVSSLAIATESVISKGANGLINAYALRAIDLIFKNLPLVYREPHNQNARTQLSMASLMSGIAFTVSNLSISLAVALALSTRLSEPINKLMGVILPHIMEYNLTTSPGKYVQMSKVMDEDVKEITVIEAAIKAVEGVRKLEIEIDMPQRLSQFDITKTDFSRIADIAMGYPFIQNAPRQLSRDEIETILIAAY